MASASPDLTAARSKLKAIIQELIPLAANYERPQPGALRIEDPLITKANELIAIAQTPTDKATSLVLTSLETSVLRTLLHLNIIQSIPASGSISLASLSTKTTVEPALLTRLLRMPIASHFINQNPSTLTYSHTPLSLDFADQESTASRTFTLFYDAGLSTLQPLHKYLTHQHSILGRWEEPGASRDSTRFNLETWHAGVEGEKTAFEVMESDPERMEIFQRFMALGRSVNPSVGYYDFGRLADEESGRKVLVDVGGGQGYALAAILAAHPSIKPQQCVLQDTPPVIALAQSFNPANLPQGVVYTPHDFFSPQPIHGAKAYYLKAIAHDLSDDNLVRVLERIVEVMAEDSRVLIAENVVPEVGCGKFLCMSDLFMMGIGGKERTEEGFRSVLGRVGLEVERVWWVGGGSTYAVIEARLIG